MILIPVIILISTMYLIHRIYFLTFTCSLPLCLFSHLGCAEYMVQRSNEYDVFKSDYIQKTFRSVRWIYIADVIAYSEGAKVDVFVVMNIIFIKKYYRMRDNNAVMVYNDTYYVNVNPISRRDKYWSGIYGSLVPSFSIPYSSKSITFSIRDKYYNWHFSNITVKVKEFKQPKDEIAVCLYISMYDTIPEIQRFIAYYETVGVHYFIIYLMTDYPGFESNFENIIENGHMIINRMILPKVEGRTPNQAAQMNSCYYHYRHNFKYIFLCDIDEYLISRLYPFNLYAAVENAFADHPSRNTFMIKQSHYIQTHEDGRFFFDNHDCVVPVEGRRQKNLIRYDFKGVIGIHKTQNGRKMELKNTSLLSIAHLKKKQKLDCNITDTYMSLFSPYVSQMMDELFL